MAAAVVTNYGIAEIPDNTPPTSPEYINGPRYVKKDEQQSYETKGSDSDGDTVYYMFDWGDGTHSKWLGPYASEEICSTTKTWNEQGDYIVKVKAKDDSGIQSSWTKISMKVEKNVFETFIQKIFHLLPFLRSYYS